MQRKLMMNTALCATLCQAITTRSLIAQASQDLEDALGSNLVLAQTRNKMMTTAEVLANANANGLAQVQDDASDNATAANEA